MPKLLPFAALLFFCFACSPEQDELNVRLTLEDREEIDRRVTVYMDSLRPLFDSLCTASMTDRIAIATDSIVQRRLEEEVRLRARIPQNLRNDR